MNSQSKISRDTLMGVLVTVCVIIAASLFPFLALPFRVFTPLPILFYRFKLGRPQGILILIITTLVIAVVFGDTTPTLLSVLGLMFIGFVMGELFEKKIAMETTILSTSGIVVLYATICLFYCSAKAETSTLTFVSNHINENINIFLHVCKEANISNELTTILEQQRKYVLDFALLIIPSSTIIMVTLIAWINLIVAKPLMRKSDINYPNFGRLNHWSTPENLIWWLIGFGLTLLINNGTMQFVGINGLLLVILAYFFQGIAITSFYLTKKMFPILGKLLVYSLIVINQFFFMAIVCIGIFDVWFDFRKIRTSRGDFTK